MEPHHAAWLAAHPDRTLEWLESRLRDGFDVHHLDLDRDNNAGENLVLIEHLDHMRIHGLTMSRGLRKARERKKNPGHRAKLQRRIAELEAVIAADRRSKKLPEAPEPVISENAKAFRNRQLFLLAKPPKPKPLRWPRVQCSTADGLNPASGDT